MPILRLLLLLSLVLSFTSTAHAAPESLVSLPSCTLIPTNWGDGDSFRIRTKDGKEHTVRLYGADCLEWHVNDEADARRLREQRQYFGISRTGNSPEASIAAAKNLGKSAADRTNALLAKPFTVHTAFTSALGDGRHQRIYAFITLADGRDLAAILVSEGLARAFGVYRQPHDGRSREEYREGLRDVELLAARHNRGIWALTNWDSLTEERRTQRADDADLNLASSPKSSSKSSAPLAINPNSASRDELLKLPGVGEATANRIIERRPFQNANDLTRVPGIGPKTLEKLRPHLSFPPSSTPPPKTR